MKLSIVTPAWNMQAYIAATMRSVLSQRGDFNLEYVIVNDGSTDSTEKIVLDFKRQLESGALSLGCRSAVITYVHQPNQGLYAAVNRGFSLATGDVFAWIGADDVYRSETAFAPISEWFAAHPEGEWVKGTCGLIDQEGRVVREGAHRLFRRSWIAQGIYGRDSHFIEQESVFWRRSLWDKVGGFPPQYRSAGDYWLWIQFARHAPLVSLPVPIAYFRIRPGQISSNREQYRREQRIIGPPRSLTAHLVRLRSFLTSGAWQKKA